MPRSVICLCYSICIFQQRRVHPPTLTPPPPTWYLEYCVWIYYLLALIWWLSWFLGIQHDDHILGVYHRGLEGLTRIRGVEGAEVAQKMKIRVPNKCFPGIWDQHSRFYS